MASNKVCMGFGVNDEQETDGEEKALNFQLKAGARETSASRRQVCSSDGATVKWLKYAETSCRSLFIISGQVRASCAMTL